MLSLIALCATIKLNGAEIPIETVELNWISSENGTSNRVVLVNIGKIKTAIPFPYVLRLVTKASPGSAATGLVHSGYTDDDPDGKSVLLNCAVQVAPAEIFTAEREELLKAGYSISKGAEIRIEGYKLEISLKRDKSEESRLKQTIALPQITVPGSGVIPIQIMWKGYEGKKIYDYLTAADGQLKILLSANACVVISFNRNIKASKNELINWWQRRFGSASAIQWLGDSSILVMELANEGIFSIGDRTASVQDLIGEVNGLGKKIDGVTKLSESGMRTITKSELMAIPFDSQSTQEITIPFVWNSSVSPGEALILNPGLVKDLTSGSVGLDAIKGK